jgi:hypothetical protein
MGIGNNFLNRTQMTQQLREGIDMGIQKIKKLLHNKRNGHQIEEAAHRMGETSVPDIHLIRD